MRIPLLALVAILFFASLPASAATDGDAGSGGDAPDNFEDALPVALGTFEGSLPRLDHSDHFRYVLPAGIGVRIIVTPLEGEVALYTLKADGSIRSGTALSASPAEIRSVAYDGIVGLVVIAGQWPVAYRVEASQMMRDDIAIIALEVTERDALGLQRDVRVVVENQGAGHNGGSDERLSVTAVHADGSTRLVGWAGWWQVAPGETRELTISWDTAGELGDVQLVATMHHPRDEDQSDNVLAIRQTVLSEGEGTDLLNQRREIQAADARAFVTWYSFPSSTPGVPFVWGYAHVRSDAAYCRTEPTIGFGCGFPGLEPVYWALVDALP